jgi:hypothetical protein
VKLKRKINITIRYKKKSKEQDQDEKKYHKFGFSNEIKNKLKFYKMAKNIN